MSLRPRYVQYIVRGEQEPYDYLNDNQTVYTCNVYACMYEFVMGAGEETERSRRSEASGEGPGSQNYDNLHPAVPRASRGFVEAARRREDSRGRDHHWVRRHGYRPTAPKLLCSGKKLPQWTRKCVSFLGLV